MYVSATFLIPAVFVPWPFISAQYGKDGYFCWLRGSASCAAVAFNILSRLLLWHIWAVLVWLFTLAVVVLTFYRYCVHQSISPMTKQKATASTYAIISILIIFIIEVVANACLFLWKPTSFLPCDTCCCRHNTSHGDDLFHHFNHSQRGHN